MRNIARPVHMNALRLFLRTRGQRLSDRANFRSPWNSCSSTARFLQRYADRYVRTSACRAAHRGQIDKPLEIDKLGSLALDLPAPKKGSRQGHTIAVIGGGPGGLSAAWQLALKGHSVDLYEATGKLGGKIEHCIPRDRLPQEILRKNFRGSAS